MGRKKTIRDVDPQWLEGRTAVVRADLNVPLDAGHVADDQRVVASVPTLRLLLDAGARAVVLSHLGRPRGARDRELSLRPVADCLATHLGREVAFDPEPLGTSPDAVARALSESGVVVLENTRFLPGDTEDDPELSTSWAGLGDLFVNDAFGAAHRAHASTSGLADAMRARGGEAVAGLLMAKELRFLRDALEHPERPFVLILGGAKISGKIDVIDALLPRVDRLLVGGAMANTFLAAMGIETGASLVEPDRVDTARAVLADAGDKLVLPVDCVVGERLEEGAPTRIVERSQLAPDERVGDIGPETVAAFGREIAGARTIVWNGPMGVFEIDGFAEGTLGVARAVAEACDRGSMGVLGGGDSAAAAAEAGVTARLTHVSTGGGASLELLAGAQLPGVESLTDADGGG